MTFRPVKLETLAKPTMEGAGVNLHRVFGFNDPKESDPFLMLETLEMIILKIIWRIPLASA